MVPRLLTLANELPLDDVVAFLEGELHAPAAVGAAHGDGAGATAEQGMAESMAESMEGRVDAQLRKTAQRPGWRRQTKW